MNDIVSENAQKILMDILNEYMRPSFGSMPKKEIDVLIFAKMVEIGMIDINNIYDIVSKLRITRAKARNLIYDYNLRKMENEDVQQELAKMLSNAIVERENNGKVLMLVENPVVLDYMKDRLKSLKHIADATYSPENVRLSVDAFASLFEDVFRGRNIYVQEELQKIGVKKNVKEIVSDVVARIVDNKLGEGTSDLAKKAWNALSSWIKGDSSDKTAIAKLYDDKNN